jgi:hypothetical protein
MGNVTEVLRGTVRLTPVEYCERYCAPQDRTALAQLLNLP